MCITFNSIVSRGGSSTIFMKKLNMTVLDFMNDSYRWIYDVLYDFLFTSGQPKHI